MRYLLTIFLLATVARANDFLPFQVDGNNNVSFPTNINSAGGLTVTGAGGVNATVARIDGTGFKWYGTNVPPGFTNYLGIHGGLGAHDLFGNWFVVSTNGYVEYSNAATQVQILINTTNTAGQITIISPSSTNLFSFPKNNAPTWNGMNLQTNSSGGSVTTNYPATVFMGSAIVTNGLTVVGGTISGALSVTNPAAYFSGAGGSPTEAAGAAALITGWGTALVSGIIYASAANGTATNGPGGIGWYIISSSINPSTSCITTSVITNGVACGQASFVSPGANGREHVGFGYIYLPATNISVGISGGSAQNFGASSSAWSLIWFHQ